MKTIVELPDQLMTEVQVLAELEQRSVGDVLAELVRVGLASRVQEMQQSTNPNDAPKSLAEWYALVDRAMDGAPDGPSARSLLNEERNRLDHMNE